MIIYITGIPAAGKTTLVESIEKELGEHSDCSPLPLFKGKLYKDTFVMHCDTLSYGTIGKFKDFVNFFEKSNMLNCLIEGDRFTSADSIEWLLDNYPNSKVFILTVDKTVEKQRQESRTQSSKWIDGRHTVINNIRKNFLLMNRLTIRDTYGKLDIVKQEIMDILKNE